MVARVERHGRPADAGGRPARGGAAGDPLPRAAEGLNAPPLRETFDSVAATYDVRPGYPEQLFDDLISIAGLTPGARLLEIGCATGTATLPLLHRGFRMTCVELGPRLAEAARRRLAGHPVDIHTAAFETWDGPAEAFDLVFAATAWHWVDPDQRYRRAHGLLRPGGHLAFWAARHAFPRGFDPFFVEIQDVYRAIGEGREDDRWLPPEEMPDESSDITSSGLFDDVRVRRYVWETWYTAEEYIALLNTFSGHIRMPADRRKSEQWRRD